jgi:hypothetical protein
MKNLSFTPQGLKIAKLLPDNLKILSSFFIVKIKFFSDNDFKFSYRTGKYWIIKGVQYTFETQVRITDGILCDNIKHLELYDDTIFSKNDVITDKK